MSLCCHFSTIYSSRIYTENSVFETEGWRCNFVKCVSRERREWDKGTRGTKKERKGWRMKTWKKLIPVGSSIGVCITEVTDELQRYFCGCRNPGWIMYICKRGVSVYTPNFLSCCWYTLSNKQPRKNILKSVSVDSFKFYMN